MNSDTGSTMEFLLSSWTTWEVEEHLLRDVTSLNFILEEINYGGKPYNCSVCDKRFPHKIGLLIHGKAHRKDYPFKCLICDKRFAEKYHLVSHMKIHRDEKPYYCKICKRMFKYEASLIMH